MSAVTETTIKRRISRVPSIYIEAECRLDEFSTADIIQYLQDKGEEAAGGAEFSNGGGLYITPLDLNHIETLVLCGQDGAALEIVRQIISEAIGRKI